MDKFIYLAQTDPIPKDCIAVRPDLDQNIVLKLERAFMEYKDRGIGKERESSTINGFVAANDENYDIIREVVRDAG